LKIEDLWMSLRSVIFLGTALSLDQPCQQGACDIRGCPDKSGCKQKPLPQTKSHIFAIKIA
jgi:hypothetical protein